MKEKVRQSSEVDDGSMVLSQTYETNFTWSVPHSPIREANTEEIPCQNCGEIVTVSIPHNGCVFCYACTHGFKEVLHDG